MTLPDQEHNPALQEWIDARQREANFSNAVKESTLNNTRQLAEATTTTLGEIAEKGDCGHRINLQNAYNYLHKPEGERTDDDKRLFSTTLENLTGAFGTENAILVYRAWERRPQAPTEE